ncbi:hypothetical protein ABBQ38_001956 [Trebouxia sp. C0009 RCD-2024]
MQVQKERIQKAQQYGCLCEAVQAADPAPTAAPQALPAYCRETDASPDGHQQAAHTQPSQTHPAEECEEEDATPHDCKTPHHSMLPAPGANMLSEAAHAVTTSAVSGAEPCAGQEDPIMVTAGPSHRHSNRSMPARRRLRSKTWNTLNFQQAPNAAQQTSQASLTSHPTPAASPSAPAPVAAMLQHHSPHGAAHSIAQESPPDATGGPMALVQHAKRQHSIQTQHNHGHSVTAALPSSMPSMPVSHGVSQLAGAGQELQPALAASRNTQLSKAEAPGASAAAQRYTTLEGSETQPDPHFVQAANDTAGSGTPLASVLVGSAPNLQPGLIASQVDRLDAEGSSPACENIPDSSGNTFAPLCEAQLREGSRSDLAASKREETNSVAGCSSQDEQGWHVQLGSAVVSLIAQGR